MLLGPRQQWLFKKFGIVTLFTSIEAQAIVFVTGPLVNAPLIGMLIAGEISI